MCFCCQSYSSHTGSGVAIIVPAMHKGRGFLQDTVLKRTFTWVFLPHKHETKDAAKQDTKIRGNTQLCLTWDLETDLSPTKKVRGSILENNGKWNPLSAQVAGSYIQSNCLGTIPQTGLLLHLHKGLHNLTKKGWGNPDKQNVHYSCGLHITRLKC